MDPDKTLADIRHAIRNGEVDTVFDLFEGLDDWLTKGGFPPNDWNGGH
jgi:hypothetical protein